MGREARSPDSPGTTRDPLQEAASLSHGQHGVQILPRETWLCLPRASLLPRGINTPGARLVYFVSHPKRPSSSHTGLSLFPGASPTGPEVCSWAVPQLPQIISRWAGARVPSRRERTLDSEQTRSADRRSGYGLPPPPRQLVRVGRKLMELPSREWEGISFLKSNLAIGPSSLNGCCF